MTDGLYLFIYHIWRFRRQLSLSNLKNSFPEKSAPQRELIARQAYCNACNMIAEVLKAAVMEESELRRRVRIVNPEAIETFTKAGQSVVLLASHHCNWEWLLLASCLELKISVDAVYKPLRVGAIDRFMLQTRSRFGGRPIPAQDFLVEVLKRRAGPRVFGLVADQTPLREEEKHWTQFLSQDTAFFVGADKIARLTRSPVFFVGMTRLRRGYYEARVQLLAQPPYSAQGTEIIERYARAAESHIVEYPADWLWMYRKWKYKKPLYA
uniref:Lipid A biosynthesis lauroyl (Or palmitoleoyl) acyltransferase n=1 Tax=uncultured bacterium CSL142 TaxID=1091569 RepID=G4WVL6_9BACT|nr:lipid A biosynthesis lauroyl (or palmitoleoyl) acyltransferase [uncultured bacterium CSL142]